MSGEVISKITNEATSQGLDPSFVLALAHQESGYNQNARSKAGAIGVMQLMPHTASDLGVDPTDVDQNIHGGVKYIKQLAQKYGGDPQKVAAAYNAGPGAVDKYGGVPPYAETQDYVKRVTGQPPETPQGMQVIPKSDVQDPAAILRNIQANMAATSGPAMQQHQTDESQAQSPAGASPDALADPGEILKNVGAAAGPDPNGEHVSSSRAKANEMAEAHSSVLDNPVAAGAYGTASSALLGAGPMISGAEHAAGNLATNVLANMGVGHNTGMNSGDVYRAEMEAYQHKLDQQPVLAQVGEGVVGGLAGGLEGGLVRGAENVGSSALKAVAPKLASKVVGTTAEGAERLAPTFLSKVAGGAAVGAGYGATESASQGKDLGETALSSLGGAATGGALTGAFEGLVSPALSKAGEALASGAKRDSLASDAALEAISRANPNAAADIRARSAENPGMIAGEALPEGRDILQRAADANPESVSPVKAAVLDRAGGQDTRLATAAEDATGIHPENAELEASRHIEEAAQSPQGSEGQAARMKAATDPGVVQQRISSALERETGIDPQTANASTEDLVNHMRQGPAKEAYDNALQGRGVWTPKLAELAQEPEIKSAMNAARRLSPGGGLVDNPGVSQAPKGPPKVQGLGASAAAPSERMSAEEYQRLMKGQDLEGYIKGDEAGPAHVPEAPSRVPTDRFWDTAKKMLDRSMSRDAFGRTEATTENHLRGEMSARLRDALDEAIPGYKEARAISGDYLQVRQAHENAPALGKAGETAKSFQGRWAKMSEGERDATQRGVMGKLYESLDAVKTGGRLTLSPRDQKILATLFGDARGSRIAAIFEREAELAKTKPAEGLEKVLERRYKEGRQLANGGSSAPSPEALAKAREAMSPQERRMQELGHLAELNRKLQGRGADLDKLSEPGHQSIIRALHGEGGEKLLETIAREKALAASGADLAGVRSAHRGKSPLNLTSVVATGLVSPKLAATQVGHHALHGLVDAAITKLGGGVTARVANALGDYLSRSPEELAAALDAHNAPKPLSRTLTSRVAHGATAGVSNALSGFES